MACCKMNLGVDITGNGIATALAGHKITLINDWMDINTSILLLLATECGGCYSLLSIIQGLMNGIPFLSFRRPRVRLTNGCLLLSITVTGHATAFFSSGLYNHMSNNAALIFSKVAR